MNVLVTGCNSGIGLETCRQLLMMNVNQLGTLYVCCRSKAKAEEVIANELNKDSRCVACPDLDMSDLNNVPKFVNELKNSEKKMTYLNVLINNAGIMALQNNPRFSKQDYEEHFAVNHLAPYFLTTLLQPLLLEGFNKFNSPSRVINVSGDLFRVVKKLPNGPWPVEMFTRETILGDKKGYNYTYYYALSKLFNILSAAHLNRTENNSDAARKQTKLVGFSLHPGVVQTNLAKDVQFGYYLMGLMRLLFYFLPIPENTYTVISAEQAAKRVMHLVTLQIRNDSSYDVEYFNLNQRETNFPQTVKDKEVTKSLIQLSNQLIAKL